MLGCTEIIRENPLMDSFKPPKQKRHNLAFSLSVLLISSLYFMYVNLSSVVACLPLYNLTITNPTTSNPKSVNDEENITILFDYLKDGINLTYGVKVLNVTIGNLFATILPHFREAYNSTLFYDPFNTLDSNWTPSTGGVWDIVSNELHADNCGTSTELTLKEFDLNGYDKATITFSYHEGTGNLESNDCVYYSFYDGSTWGSWNTLFCNDIGTSPIYKTINIPQAYLVNNFKFKFKCRKFQTSGSDFYADDFEINVSRDFKEFTQWYDNGWHVNVTVPSGLTGLQDLFLNATFKTDNDCECDDDDDDDDDDCEIIADDTQEDAINYGGDNTGPIVNLELPLNNTLNTTTNTIDFTYNVSDASDIANCSLIINNGINFTHEANISKNTPGRNLTVSLTNGDYLWSVRCVDIYNNIGNAPETRNLSILTTLINNTPPDVTDLTPIKDSNLSQNSIVEITANVTDNLAVDTVLVNISWNNSSELLNMHLKGGNVYQANFTAGCITETYNLTIIANDTENSLNNTESSYFNTINTPPDVVIILPLQGTVYDKDETVPIKAHIMDACNGVNTAFANISWDETSEVITLTDANNDSIYEGDFENTSHNGLYNVRIVANDTLNALNDTETTHFLIQKCETCRHTQIQASITAKVTEVGEKALLTASIRLPNGKLAKQEDLSSINITIYRIEGYSNSTIVNNEIMTPFIEGVFYYEFHIGNNQTGTYLAHINVATNQTIPESLDEFVTFYVGPRGTLSIEGVSPSLIQVNKLVRLAAEIRKDGEPIPQDKLENATLSIEELNNTVNFFDMASGLNVTDGLVYLDGSFNSSAVYYLNWSVNYYGYEKTVREIVVVVDWDEKFENISQSNNSVLLDILIQNKDYLLEVLRKMELSQEFSDEEIFLITDSVQSMTKVIDDLSGGKITTEEADERYKKIKENLDKGLAGLTLLPSVMAAEDPELFNLVKKTKPQSTEQVLQNLTKVLSISVTALAVLTVIKFKRKKQATPLQYEKQKTEAQIIAGENGEFPGFFGFYLKKISPHIKRKKQDPITNILFQTRKEKFPGFFDYYIKKLTPTFPLRESREVLSKEQVLKKEILHMHKLLSALEVIKYHTEDTLIERELQKQILALHNLKNKLGLDLIKAPADEQKQIARESKIVIEGAISVLKVIAHNTEDPVIKKAIKKEIKIFEEE